MTENKAVAREAEAVAAARRLIAARALEGRHHVAATVLTAAGGAYTALNLECTLDRASICAEAIAIGMATLAEKEAVVVFSVAVNRRGEVLPPCGLCRELLWDYGPAARVAIPGGDDYRVEPLPTLMPVPYKAALRGGPGRRAAE